MKCLLNIALEQVDTLKKKWLSGIMKIVMVIDKSILFMFL
jgi:hypothetical protein